jgi:hypothetical protein
MTGVKFDSKDENYLSLFQRYSYENNNQLYNCSIDNHNLIKYFLDHVVNIISDGKNELYNSVLNWISYLLQNPGSKTETALIIMGKQGIGRNKFFTDVISKLFGRN